MKKLILVLVTIVVFIIAAITLPLVGAQVAKNSMDIIVGLFLTTTAWLLIPIICLVWFILFIKWIFSKKK